MARRIYLALAGLLFLVGTASAQTRCLATAAARTATEGQSADISCDLNRNLRTTASGGGGGAATVADGADVTQGAKADAKSTATDTTAVSVMSVLKQISASVQAPVPGTGATNLGKAEDAAHTSGDTGVLVFGVQTATPADKAAEGDNAVFEISAGRVWVSATIDAALPAGSNSIGTVVPAGNIASDGVDSGNPVKIGGKYTATGPIVADGDRVDLRLTADGSIFAAPALNSVTPSDGISNTGNFGQGIQRNSGLVVLYPITGTLIRGDTGTWNTAFNCTSSAVVNVTAGSTTEIVALTASQTIRVCSFSVAMSAAGTAAFVYGTGTNCGTGTTSLTGATPLATGTPWGLSAGNGPVFKTASANALCVAAVTGNVVGFVSYAKF